MTKGLGYPSSLLLWMGIKKRPSDVPKVGDPRMSIEPNTKSNLLTRLNRDMCIQIHLHNDLCLKIRQTIEIFWSHFSLQTKTVKQ